MVVYLRLIRKYMDDFQEFGWFQKGDIELKQKEYDRNMDRVFNRLQREHNFNRQKFYELQEQAQSW